MLFIEIFYFDICRKCDVIIKILKINNNFCVNILMDIFKNKIYFNNYLLIQENLVKFLKYSCVDNLVKGGHSLDLVYVRNILPEYFKNYHTLYYLENIGIFDQKYLRYMSNCHTVDLRDCRIKSNKFLRYLKNCHTVNIDVRRNSSKYLKNCYNLDLNFCIKISKHYKYLKNIMCLYLKNSPLSNFAINSFKNCYNLLTPDFTISKGIVQYINIYEPIKVY